MLKDLDDNKANHSNDDIQDNETQILPGGGKMSDYQNEVMPHANTTLGVHDDNLHLQGWHSDNDTTHKEKRHKSKTSKKISQIGTKTGQRRGSAGDMQDLNTNQ